MTLNLYVSEPIRVVGIAKEIIFSEAETSVVPIVVVAIGLVKLPLSSESSTTKLVDAGKPENLKLASKELKSD